VIDIGGQGLGDKIVMELINQLRYSCVVELSLSNNNLTDETLISLSTILPSLSQLGSLNISANQIRDKGIQAIFAVDIFPFNLKHLDISRNILGPVSAYHIGSALVPQSKNISERSISKYKYIYICI
jgi:Ran GTPase-activating protein (RanGAP) involved in mRNA processing and transport